MSPDSLVIVVMGVAGAGKTTVGRLLAEDLGWCFRDADEFHPPENIARMSAGIPLTDADRAPWLAAIRHYIERCLREKTSAVVTCSALRESYRRVLVVDPRRVRLVHLTGSRELIDQRLRSRQGHFMKSGMSQSQFATLEPPADALNADVTPPPVQIVAQIRRALSL